MHENLRTGFRLRDMYICPLEGRIEGPSGSRHVQPKVMDVLLCLAQSAGQVVEREEILQQVWDGSPLADEALTRCVSELRHQLGDHSDNPSFIRTIPKRGYQLIASVQPESSAEDTISQSSEVLDYPSAFAALVENLRRRRVFRAVGVYAIFAWLTMQVADVVVIPLGFPAWTMTAVIWIAALGFALTVLLAWTLQITEKGIEIDESADTTATIQFRGVDYIIAGSVFLILSFFSYQLIANRESTIVISTESGEFELPRIETGPIDPNSIAVLPFFNVNEDPKVKYLGISLAEEVLNLLANIRELKVPSRDSSFRFKDVNQDRDRIVSELRVRNVLGGSVGGNAAELAVSAQLVDADSGSQLWSQDYKRQNTNLLVIRDEIAQAVVESLKLVLSVESQSIIARAPTQNSDAYDYYLQALSYLRRPKTEQTLDNAEGLFQRAIDLDPEYAKAHAGLCEVHLGKYQQLNQLERVKAAERACTTALLHDPNLPEVYAALGTLHRLTGEYATAELDFQRAIVLNPRMEPAYYGLGRVYMSLNRLEEAEVIFKYAVDLEPGYWGTHLALGNYYLEFGRPAEAIVPFRRVTELNPDYAMGFNNLGSAFYNSGDVDNGEKAFLRSIEISPTWIALSNIGTMYYNEGRYESAANMFQQGLGIVNNDFGLWGRLASANRFIPGREEEADQAYLAAIDLAKDNLNINPNDTRTLAYLAYYYANTGNESEARAAIAKARKLGPSDPHVIYYSAHVDLKFGDQSAALGWLEMAADLGYSINSIASDPDFEPLRSNARFQAIVD